MQQLTASYKYQSDVSAPSSDDIESALNTYFDSFVKTNSKSRD